MTEQELLNCRDEDLDELVRSLLRMLTPEERKLVWDKIRAMPLEREAATSEK